jgi:hypothetical protein
MTQHKKGTGVVNPPLKVGKRQLDPINYPRPHFLAGRAA